MGCRRRLGRFRVAMRRCFKPLVSIAALAPVVGHTSHAVAGAGHRDAANSKQLCPHLRRRVTCVDCGGRQVCEHRRVRSQCRECKGSQLCLHGCRRSTCRVCGGSQICPHLLHARACPLCCASSRAVSRSETDQSRRDRIARERCVHGKWRVSCLDCATNGATSHSPVRLQGVQWPWGLHAREAAPRVPGLRRRQRVPPRQDDEPLPRMPWERHLPSRTPAVLLYAMHHVRPVSGRKQPSRRLPPPVCPPQNTAQLPAMPRRSRVMPTRSTDQPVPGLWWIRNL